MRTWRTSRPHRRSSSSGGKRRVRKKTASRRNVNLIMSPFLWETSTCALKNADFPRLLRFRMWLGVRILDVNSCSLLGSRRPRSGAKFGQVNPDGSELLWPKTCREIKRGCITARLPFCFLFHPVLPVHRCKLCYVKRLKVMSGDRYSRAVIARVSCAVSRWKPVSQCLQQERWNRNRVTSACLFGTDRGGKMRTLRLLVNDIPHFYLNFITPLVMDGKYIPLFYRQWASLCFVRKEHWVVHCSRPAAGDLQSVKPRSQESVYWQKVSHSCTVHAIHMFWFRSD